MQTAETQDLLDATLTIGRSEICFTKWYYSTISNVHLSFCPSLQSEDPDAAMFVLYIQVPLRFQHVPTFVAQNEVEALIRMACF